jgi:RNA polymerase sigma-70 factor (ECF subfamily)
MTEPNRQPDGEEFTRLLLQNQKRLWGLILSLVPNGSDADDVMQETCVVMWRKFEEFQRGTDFGAWGLRVARFQVMSYYQRQRRNQARLSDELLESITEKIAEPAWEASARGDALRECLAKLKPREYDLIQRRYHAEQNIEEIAAALSATSHAIYKALARLQTRLLGCMELRLRREEVS